MSSLVGGSPSGARAATADMQGRELRGLAVIDEFAALAAEHVHRLFGRARSAGLSVLLGTQSLADLRTARPDDPTDSLTEQVLGKDGIRWRARLSRSRRLRSERSPCWQSSATF
ncbi:MAG: hypothetical protein ACTHK3_08230 [Solirubrobacterales bacterium]